MGLKNLKSQFDLVPDSLPQIPTTSPFQDLDGEPGPTSQLPTEAASQKHIDSLSQVPGFDSNSPFQDISNGATPPQYLDNLPG